MKPMLEEFARRVHRMRRTQRDLDGWVSFAGVAEADYENLRRAEASVDLDLQKLVPQGEGAADLFAREEAAAETH